MISYEYQPCGHDSQFPFPNSVFRQGKEKEKQRNIKHSIMASAYTGQSSALIGQPPSTAEDYWIVKGILARLGSHADPALGVLVPPARPPNANFETRSPQIVAADSVCIALVILITGSRLLIRALHHGLKWGWDDWVIILGSVGVLDSGENRKDS